MRSQLLQLLLLALASNKAAELLAVDGGDAKGPKPPASMNILRAWNAGSERPSYALPLAAAVVAVAAVAAVMQQLVTAAACSGGETWDT